MQLERLQIVKYQNTSEDLRLVSYIYQNNEIVTKISTEQKTIKREVRYIHLLLIVKYHCITTYC